MRTYIIKGNNKTYEVEVEEKNGTVAATKISTADEPVKPAEPVKADESGVPLSDDPTVNVHSTTAPVTPAH